MSFLRFVASLSLFWLATHALFHYLKRRTRSAHDLPSSRRLVAGGRSLLRWRVPSFLKALSRLSLGMNTSNAQISLQHVHLKLTTTAWNEGHDRLSTVFLRRRNARLKRVVQGLYDIGTFLAVLGMCGCVAGLCWLVFAGLEDALGPKKSSPGISVAQTVHKREVLEGTKAGGRTGSGVVTLIIPGVTVPLSDLPMIVASVFFSQVVHEFGHAVAAALDSIPLISCGASLTVIIPSAFVSFSSSSLASLRPPTRARIIAAGPFHNLVTWALLITAKLIGIGGWIRSMGYIDVSKIGRNVVSVEGDSPLYGYLNADKSVVIALDDEPLNVEQDVWPRYLLDSQANNGKKGWCVHHDNLEPSELCCPPGKGNETYACIRHLRDDLAPMGCLDPIGLFTNISAPRCTVSAGCVDEDLCGVFDSKLGILRIRAREGLEGQERVLLWSGPRKEVWEQVSVSKWRGRLGIFQSGYLGAVATFQSYMEMTALSLFFFNLLPFWHLDGMQLLNVLLCFGVATGPVAYIDSENQRGGDSERMRRSIRLSRTVSGVIGLLMCLNLLLQIYHVL